MKFAAAVTLVMMVSTATASPLRFELRCNGTQTNLPSGEVLTLSPSYKVDLVLNKWCSNACRTIQDIQSVTPEKLVFIDKTTHGADGTGHMLTVADRIKGTISSDFVMPEFHSSIKMDLSCTAIEFDGFQKF